MRSTRRERVAGIELRRSGEWCLEGYTVYISDHVEGEHYIYTLNVAARRALASVGYAGEALERISTARAIVSAALGEGIPWRLVLSRYSVEETGQIICKDVGVGREAEWRIRHVDGSRLAVDGVSSWTTRRAACEALRAHLDG